MSRFCSNGFPRVFSFFLLFSSLTSFLLVFAPLPLLAKFNMFKGKKQSFILVITYNLQSCKEQTNITHMVFTQRLGLPRFRQQQILSCHPSGSLQLPVILKIELSASDALSPIKTCIQAFGTIGIQSSILA